MDDSHRTETSYGPKSHPNTKSNGYADISKLEGKSLFLVKEEQYMETKGQIPSGKHKLPIIVAGLVLVFLVAGLAQARTLWWNVHNHSKNDLVKWSMDFSLPAKKRPTHYSVRRWDGSKWVDESWDWKGKCTRVKAGSFHVNIENNKAAAVPYCTHLKFDVTFNTDDIGYSGANLKYKPDPCPRNAVKKAICEDPGNFKVEIDNAVFYGGSSGQYISQLGINVPADTYAYLYQINNIGGLNPITEFRIFDVNDPYGYPDVNEGLFDPCILDATHDGQVTVFYKCNVNDDPNTGTAAISVADFNGLGPAGVDPNYWGPDSIDGNDYVATFTGLYAGQKSNILIAFSKMGPAIQEHGENFSVSGGGNSRGGLVWVPGPWPGDWAKEDVLAPSDVNIYDDFGCSVAVSGYYAIIGAMYNDDQFYNGGAAYIFKKDLDEVNEPDWPQKQKLTPSDPNWNVSFGQSVDIHGDYAIVGAPYAKDAGNNPVGAAYIFRNINENWTQIQKLNPISPNQYDDFGCSVAICGKLAVVGAKYDDTKTTDAGAAYVFAANDVDPNNWVFVQKLYASDPNILDDFGYSLDICCHTIIVAAPWSDTDANEGGSVYIFESSDKGKTWSQTCKLPFPSECNEYDNFGMSVSVCSALNADRFAIVGAPHAYGTDPNSGLAFIYAPNEADPNNWVKQASLVGSDLKEFDYFGSAVSIHGRRAIVGAYHHYMDETGAAYIFEHYDPNWTEVARLSPAPGNWIKFGDSVAINRDYAVIGAPKQDVGGTAYIHKRISSVADLDGDFFVDFYDYSLLAMHYLDRLGDPDWRCPLDISEKIDDIVGLSDLCALAQDWLETRLYP
jgi:hypothetical protein